MHINVQFYRLTIRDVSCTTLKAVYICVYASLSERLATRPMKQLRTVTNVRQPFRFGRMLLLTHFKSISDFMFVNEIISFFFRSYFDGFRLTARETGDPIDTTRHSKDQ